ncbi:hypothetical protein P280DRAFT_526069 [Massarina eburnea CBS 473.64]|uniref:Homeodomain-like protein n=1 Tax=Massarina eburnea CBS 473.64 TaxID=1395130 RepID=A0A6A6RX68_9PLEO|nr:hypothetical protein P280DRAFT_526069 [Massarina eburnea CBS 473.64]
MTPDTPSGGPINENEAKTIRRMLSTYQRENELSTDALVALVQFNLYGEGATTDDRRAQAQALWSNMHEHLRGKHSLKVLRDWVRKRYTVKMKSGKWTPEEDQRLADACASGSKKWPEIASEVGTRSSANCYHRWRDYLSHRGQKNTSRWTDEEEALLLRAVDSVRDGSAIPWKRVSEAMGHTRNRVQCLRKWQQIDRGTPRRRKKSSRKSHTSHTSRDSATQHAVKFSKGHASLALWVAIAIFDSNRKADFSMKESDVQWDLMNWYVENDFEVVDAKLSGDARTLWHGMRDAAGGEQGCFSLTAMNTFNYISSMALPKDDALALPPVGRIQTTIFDAFKMAYDMHIKGWLKSDDDDDENDSEDVDDDG